MAISDILAAQIQSSLSNGIFNDTQPTRGYADEPSSYSMPDIPLRADQISKDMNSFDQWSFPADRPKYYMNLNFAAYKRNSINSIGNLSSYSVVRLPMPTNLSDAHGVSWQADALGWSGALTAQGAKALSQGNYAGAAGGLAAGAVAAGLEGARVGAGRIGNAINNIAGGAIGGAQALIGIAPNKFLTVLFKGPQYRSLQFNWRLSPRNPQEAESIRTIVKTLKNAMSPSVNPLHTMGSILFGYPDIVMMEFRPNAKYLYKFKPAVITALSANYAPGGSAGFYHAHSATDGLGAPEGIDITMQTMELEYWLGNNNRGSDGDFTDSNDTGDVYGGTYGTTYGDNGQSKGNNSRQLGTVGGGGGLPQANTLTQADLANISPLGSGVPPTVDAAGQVIDPGGQGATLANGANRLLGAGKSFFSTLGDGVGKN